ncbi:MAG TPA: GatB/YqeY domain-containing protein [Mariprofundaceae bacterium]|nr:GatB/YqeY domain-containing protein [Mariprofundaceae bacterium]
MLTQRITDDMKQAMKAGEKARLSAIRMLRSAIKDHEIELGRPLVDEDVLQLVSRLIKQRKESALQYGEAGRADLQQQELAEVGVLSAYLPAQLSGAEIDHLIDEGIGETGACGIRDMGKVMAWVRPRILGRGDMGEVSARVKERLQGV